MEQENADSTQVTKEKPNLKELDITNLIDQEACRRLLTLFGRSVEADTPRFIIPPNTEFLIPVAARAIVEGKDFEMPKVSIRDLKKLRPDVAGNAWLLSRMSKRLAYKMDKYAQRKATETASNAMARLIDFVEAFGEIENPRKQFVSEVEKLYKEIPLHGQPVGSPFFYFTRELDNLDKRPKNNKVNKKYPLVGHALAVTGLEPSNYGHDMDVAAQEIYEGMEEFLRSHEVYVEKNKPRKGQSATLRASAQLFARESLEKARETVPEALETIYQILPEDGSEFKQKLQSLANDLLNAKRQGATNEEISAALLASVHYAKSPNPN